MSTIVENVLPFAVAVALSPLPIVAVILILLSRHPRSNGLAFVFSWFLGLAFAEAIVLAVVDLINLTPGGGPTKVFATARLVVGVLALVLGIRQWRRRPAPGASPVTPGWMRSVEDYTPVRAMGLAAILSSVGNVPLILAAAAAVVRAKLDTGQAIAALGTFVLVGSLTVAAPVLYHVLAGTTATRMLNHWKVWLLQHHAMITSLLLIVVGVTLMGKGGLDLAS
jgi:hypothetical protein